MPDKEALLNLSPNPTMIDTMFRLMAVLKLVDLVKAEMPGLVAGGRMDEETAKRILASADLLRRDADQEYVHTPDELKAINTRTGILVELLSLHREAVSVKGREQFDSYLRVLKARNQTQMAEALKGLK